MQQIWHTQTGETQSWSVRLLSAPTKAEIKSTNTEFPHIQFSSFKTVGSLETNFTD